MLHCAKMCNEAAIIKIVQSWNKSWQTNGASQLSTNMYTCESALKAQMKKVGNG
jgi:hypothetical protein